MSPEIKARLDRIEAMIETLAVAALPKWQIESIYKLPVHAEVAFDEEKGLLLPKPLEGKVRV
jgi:hypothetical protein